MYLLLLQDTWQEYEYRPTLTRIVEEPDEETTVEARPRPLSFISGTASDRRSRRTQVARFTAPVDYLDDYESSTDEFSDANESGDGEDRHYRLKKKVTPPGAALVGSSSFGSTSNGVLARRPSAESNGSTDSDREMRSRKDSSLLADALTWQPPLKPMSLKEALDAWHAGQEQDCSHL